MNVLADRRAAVRRLGLLTLLLCMVVGAGFARGRNEMAREEIGLTMTEIDWDTLEIGTELTVTGKLAVYGNEPHTYLALAADDATTPAGSRLVQIEGDLLEELYELQGRWVTVFGTVTRTEIGPGFPTVIDAQEFQLEED